MFEAAKGWDADFMDVRHRIVHLLPANLPTGTAKQIGMLCDGLRQHGWDNSLCRVGSRGKTQISGRSLFRGSLSALRFTSLPQLGPELRLSKADIVHTWGGAANTFGRLVARIYLPHTPLICSERTNGNVHVAFSRRLAVWLDRRTEMHITNSASVNAPRSSRAQASLRCVRNGVPIYGESHTEQRSHFPAKRSIHSELGISADTQLVCVLHDLVAENQVKNLLWAMDLLRVIRPQVQLIIAGDGPQAKSLERYQRKVGDGPHVHFLGRRTDVFDLLCQSLCLWHAGTSGGCSNAVLEGMAMGIPVVATDTPCHRELLDDAVNGFLIRNADAAEFARKTNLLLANPVLAREFGAAGRLTAKGYSVDAMVNGYAHLYEEQLAMRPQLSSASGSHRF